MSTQTDGFTIAVAVSAVAAAGEVSTLGLLRPDGVTDTIQVTLDATGNGSTTYSASMDGTYTFTSGTTPADAKYAATAATDFPSFTVSNILLSRTMTITVTSVPSA